METTLTASCSGPLPPPQHLEEYDRIVPGAATRIVRMAEREQEIKATALEGSVGNERLKTIGAILLGAGVVAIAAYATHLGEPAIAIPLGLAGFAMAIVRWLTRQK